MFKIGDYVVYGSRGVCQVKTIGHPEAAQDNRQYYTLEPVNVTGSRVFTPVDNQKTVIRSVISKNEAKSLIANADKLEAYNITAEKQREDVYNNALKSCDCTEALRIIKTLKTRNDTRQLQGKKATVKDEQYLKKAEEALYSELTVVLNIDRDKLVKRLNEII